MGDGTTLSTDQFTPVSVESYPRHDVHTYLFEFEKNYTTSSTFGLACETNSEGCEYDIVFTTGPGLETLACTPPTIDDISCRNNAAGGAHQLKIHVFDMSRNAGSPAMALPAVIELYQNDNVGRSMYVHVEDQVDVASVENAEFKFVNGLSWGSFNTSEGTRPFNAHEWEDIRMTTLGSHTFGGGATIQNTDDSELEFDDDGNFFRAYNTTVQTTTEFVTSGSYPKRIQTQKIETSIVGCFLESSWVDPTTTGTDTISAFPACGGNETIAWNQESNTDGCPTDVNGTLYKYTCQNTVITETKYSGFMWKDDQSESSSQIPVQNAELFFIPLSSLTLEGSLFPFSQDMGANGSQFSTGYYFVRTIIDDGLTATSVATSTLHVTSPLPKMCANYST